MTLASVVEVEKVWLSNTETQRYLGVSQAFLKRLRQNGAVPFYKVGGKVFYRKRDIDRLVTRGRVV